MVKSLVRQVVPSLLLVYEIPSATGRGLRAGAPPGFSVGASRRRQVKEGNRELVTFFFFAAFPAAFSSTCFRHRESCGLPIIRFCRFARRRSVLETND